MIELAALLALVAVAIAGVVAQALLDTA